MPLKQVVILDTCAPWLGIRAPARVRRRLVCRVDHPARNQKPLAPQLTKRAALSESLRNGRRPAPSRAPRTVSNSLDNSGESPFSRSVGHFAQIPGCQSVNPKEGALRLGGLAPQVELEPTTLRLTRRNRAPDSVRAGFVEPRAVLRVSHLRAEHTSQSRVSETRSAARAQTSYP